MQYSVTVRRCGLQQLDRLGAGKNLVMANGRRSTGSRGRVTLFKLPVMPCVIVLCNDLRQSICLVTNACLTLLLLAMCSSELTRVISLRLLACIGMIMMHGTGTLWCTWPTLLDGSYFGGPFTLWTKLLGATLLNLL